MAGLTKIKSGGFAAGCALPSDATATTQSSGDNSTKIATTAYADAAGGDSDKIEEGNTSVECIDSGSDGIVRIKTEGSTRLTVANDGFITIPGNIKVADMHIGNGNSSTHNSNTVFGNTAGENLASTAYYNICIGYEGGRGITTGDQNTMIGYRTGGATLTGHDNVGVGNEALQDCTGGYHNVCIGRETGQNLTTGYSNTFLGERAGYAGIVTGNSNVGIGVYAGGALTSGYSNVCIGQNAGVGVTEGYYNLCLGHAAGDEITTGDNNICIGNQSAGGLTTGNNNTIIGGSSSGFGSSTSDTVVIGIVGTERMRIDSDGKFGIGLNNPGDYHNSADRLVVGGSADTGITIASSSTSGSGNLWFADGTSGDAAYRGMVRYEHTNDAMVFKTAGDSERMRIDSSGNIGIGTTTPGAKLDVSGSDALVNGITIGKGNNGHNDTTVFGRTAGSSLANGESDNTFIGSGAGANSTTGTKNTMVGAGAGTVTTLTGSHNTGVGYRALSDMAGGNLNTAMGREAGSALGATTGVTAIGAYALYYGDGSEGSITGDFNTGVGYGVMASITSGADNTCVGQNAGAGLTTGTNNLLLGHEAGRSGSPSGTVSTGNHNVCLGDNNIANLYCADTTISSSDQRDKADITDFTHGLDWITQMRPVTYKWDRRSWYNDWDENPDVDLLTLSPDGTHKRSQVNLGLLAQDVRTIETADGYATSRDTQLLAYDNEDGKSMGIKYERIIPVLINAIKELKTANDALTARVAALEAG